MSEKDKIFVSVKSMADELKESDAVDTQRDYRKKIAYTTQDIVDKLDQQKLRDIELEFMRKATREELEDSIRKLDNHAICSGNVVCPKDTPVVIVKEDNKCKECAPASKIQEQKISEPAEEIHGPDCHCSKCCPNPNPTFLQKHKFKILAAIAFVCILILSIGWLPSGGSYDALQKAYVELIVNLPKMVLLSIAGFAVFKMAKSKDEEDKK
mgnify:FL=1